MTRQSVLVLNAGSSSLKFQVVDPRDGSLSADGLLERVDETGTENALQQLTESLEQVGVTASSLFAVGHRVVHGGARFTAPTLVDDDVLAEIEDLTRLAPLHNPPAARGIRHAQAQFPGLPQVAVFDTAWFVDLPAAAATYALDTELAAREGIRKYGMHGTSHAYVTAEAAAFLGRDPADVDLVTLHLGNGASATAVRGGRPVDTSMGFTPLEGLVMGTRPGDLDPGVLLHLMRHAGMDVDDIEDLLHHRSGLEGMTGLHDFRDLLDAIDSGDDRARTAYDVYCHRLRKYVGAYLAVLGGADALVFTAGIGENVPRLRADALSGLTTLGVEVDPKRNLDRSGSDTPRRISTDSSRVAVLVVPTNEELAIARHVADLLR
jgi:acetate kinase